MNTWHDRRTLLRHLLGRPADRFLLVLLLGGTMALWLTLRTFVADDRPMVEVYHHERLLAIYPIPEGSEEIRFIAHGDLGPSEILISGDGARISSSPCQSKRCVLSGTHKHLGDIIACVPNGILVRIGSARAGFDGIAE